MTRVIFMGTPEFAVPSLAALVGGPATVVAVVTQPDKPSGRGQQMTASPVKAFAVAHGLPVFQPPTLKAPEAVARLAELQPDVIVVAAYGQILRPAVLNLPPHGCINVHASLLPRWRGAAPVQAAILAGDQVTGSTIMLMDADMDTGPILAQAALIIQPDDTGGTLTARLAQQGADLLVETLPRWLAGEVTPQPQEQSRATLCRPLRKEQGLIDWRRPAAQIAMAVRAFNPWPAAHTLWQGQLLKVLRAQALPGHGDDAPGRTLIVDGIPAVVTGEGLLRLDEVQLAGRNAVSGRDFARGQRNFAGSRLD